MALLTYLRLTHLLTYLLTYFYLAIASALGPTNASSRDREPSISLEALCVYLEEAHDMIHPIEIDTLRLYINSFHNSLCVEGDNVVKVVALKARREQLQQSAGVGSSGGGAGFAGARSGGRNYGSKMSSLASFGAVRGLLAVEGPLAKEVLEAACDSQRPLPAVVEMLRGSERSTLPIGKIAFELREILQLHNAISVTSLGRYLMEFPNVFQVEDLDLDGVSKVTLLASGGGGGGGQKDGVRHRNLSESRDHLSSLPAVSSEQSQELQDDALVELLTLKQQGLDAGNISRLTSMQRPLPLVIKLLQNSPKNQTTISMLRESLQREMRLERTIKSRNLGAYLRSFWECFEILEHIVPEEQRLVLEIQAVVKAVIAIPKDKGGQRQVPTVLKRRQEKLRLLQGQTKEVEPVLKILTSTQPVSKSDRQILSACNKPLQIIGLVLTLNHGELPLRDLRTRVQAALGTERTIKGLPLGLYLEHFRKHFMVQKKQPNTVRLLQAVSLRKEHVVRLREHKEQHALRPKPPQFDDAPFFISAAATSPSSASSLEVTPSSNFRHPSDGAHSSLSAKSNGVRLVADPHGTLVEVSDSAAAAAAAAAAPLGTSRGQRKKNRGRSQRGGVGLMNPTLMPDPQPQRSIFDLLTTVWQQLSDAQQNDLSTQPYPLPVIEQLLRNAGGHMLLSVLREAMQTRIGLARTVKSRNLFVYLASFPTLFENRTKDKVIRLRAQMSHASIDFIDILGAADKKIVRILASPSPIGDLDYDAFAEHERPLPVIERCFEQSRVSTLMAPDLAQRVAASMSLHSVLGEKLIEYIRTFPSTFRVARTTHGYIAVSVRRRGRHVTTSKPGSGSGGGGSGSSGRETTGGHTSTAPDRKKDVFVSKGKKRDLRKSAAKARLAQVQLERVARSGGSGSARMSVYAARKQRRIGSFLEGTSKLASANMQSILAKDFEMRRTGSRARSATSAMCGRGDDLDPLNPMQDFYRNFAAAADATCGVYWFLRLADALPLLPKRSSTALTAATHTVQRNTVVDCMAFPWMKPKALSALRDTSLESLAIETDVLVGALGHVAGQLQHPRPRHNSAWRVLSKLQRLKRRLDAAPNDSPFNLLLNGRLYAPGRKRTMGGQTSNSLGSDFELAGASELGVQPDVVLLRRATRQSGVQLESLDVYLRGCEPFSADDLDLLQLHDGVNHAIHVHGSSLRKKAWTKPATIVLESDPVPSFASPADGRVSAREAAASFNRGLPFHFPATQRATLVNSRRIVIFVPRFGRQHGGAILEWEVACQSSLLFGSFVPMVTKLNEAMAETDGTAWALLNPNVFVTGDGVLPHGCSLPSVIPPLISVEGGSSPGPLSKSGGTSSAPTNQQLGRDFTNYQNTLRHSVAALLETCRNNAEGASGVEVVFCTVGVAALRAVGSLIRGGELGIRAAAVVPLDTTHNAESIRAEHEAWQRCLASPQDAVATGDWRSFAGWLSDSGGDWYHRREQTKQKLRGSSSSPSTQSITMSRLPASVQAPMWLPAVQDGAQLWSAFHTSVAERLMNMELPRVDEGSAVTLKLIPRSVTAAADTQTHVHSPRSQHDSRGGAGGAAASMASISLRERDRARRPMVFDNGGGGGL